MRGNPNPVSKWKKGQSGNPHGRPKALVDVQALARKQTKQNIEVMVDLRDNCEDYAVRLRAAVALHEIAWGKPTQAVSTSISGALVIRWEG